MIIYIIDKLRKIIINLIVIQHMNEEFYIRILFIAEGLTIHVYN